MTDRPRTWTLGVCPQCLCIVQATPGSTTFCMSEYHDREFPAVDDVRVVEWDRERIVPIIQQALAEQLRHPMDPPEPYDAAEAVFDALNGSDEA